LVHKSELRVLPITGMSHSFTDDTIDQPRGKGKSKTLNRGHSLEDGPVDGGQGRLKAAASESMLAGDSSTLGLPHTDRKGSTSKLSMLQDKLGDAARALADKRKDKAKTPFSMFKKKSSRDPSPNERNSRSRSTEYGGSLDRKQALRSGSARSPNRTSTLPITRISDEGDGNGTTSAPILGIDAPRSIIPFEFQDAMGTMGSSRGRDFGSDGSDPDLNEQDLLEMNAWAEHIDEYFYSVRIFPGQDPSQVFVGWMTPGFHNLDSHFDTKKTRHAVVSLLDQDFRIKTRLGFKFGCKWLQKKIPT